MAAAAMIPGVGPGDVAPLLSPNFDLSQAELTPEQYFVLTRVDGKISFKQIIMISGFAEEKAVGLIQALRREGAIYLPGEQPPPRKPPKVAAQPAAARPGSDPPKKPGSNPPSRQAVRQLAIDTAALEEANDLTPEQRRAILIKQAQVKLGALFEILEIGPDADKKTLKRAYFKISKEFHPDKFYGKSLGSFRARLDEIFHASTNAFEHLDDDAKRKLYLEGLRPQEAPQKPAANAPPPPGPNPVVRAAELFELACQHQVTGEKEKSLEEFAQACRLDPQPRYLKRAAEAALRAQELRSAEEYATKAAELDARDAGVHRMLAKVYRATGRIVEARKELETAVRLDPDNAFIAAELDELNER